MRLHSILCDLILALAKVDKCFITSISVRDDAGVIRILFQVNGNEGRLDWCEGKIDVCFTETDDSLATDIAWIVNCQPRLVDSLQRVINLHSEGQLGAPNDSVSIQRLYQIISRSP